MGQAKRDRMQSESKCESEAKNNNARQEHSAKSLTQLYTVIIGVALSMCVRTAIHPDVGVASIEIDTILLFLSFVVTIVPFYHGALRHIDDTYVLNHGATATTSVLIFDFAILIFHGLVFVLLALLIAKPNQFMIVLLAVLSIDVLWGIIVSNSLTKALTSGAEGRWAFINSIFVIISGLYVYLNKISIFDAYYPWHFPVLIAVVCVLRTVIDYWSCKKFYFPVD